jgi:AcrR family transcriptional regulator
MRNADETRRRILDAATQEFASRGIAGGRIDRIAAASEASKPMLYAYFGSKEQLFEAVFAAHVLGNSDRVPFTADDLPGYAARLYDDYIADPALLRLVEWRRLEQEPDGYLYKGLDSMDAAHRSAIVEQQESGRIRRDFDPHDVWSLLISMASTWAGISITEVARSDDAPSVLARRRLALGAAVQSAFSPEGHS